ncbi:MAG: type I secretion C-terminal target domain-containing protein, partial [Aeromonas sp.]|uniref:type I secretion C-terminal target domain-containing protein n=1 Tax=Aeromonas sp. TaxID=647 RepID=UPI003D6B1B91
EGDKLDLSDLLDRSGTNDLNTLKGMLNVFEDTQGVHINLNNGTQDILLMNQSFASITGSTGNTANQVLDYMLQHNLLDLDKS